MEIHLIRGEGVVRPKAQTGQLTDEATLCYCPWHGLLSAGHPTPGTLNLQT